MRSVKIVAIGALVTGYLYMRSEDAAPRATAAAAPAQAEPAAEPPRARLAPVRAGWRMPAPAGPTDREPEPMPLRTDPAWRTCVERLRLTVDQESRMLAVLSDTAQEMQTIATDVDDLERGSFDWPIGARTPEEAQRLAERVVDERADDAAELDASALTAQRAELRAKVGAILTEAQLSAWRKCPQSDPLALAQVTR